MDREKVLYLLDINDEKKLNKNNEKALLVFDISLAFCIVGVGMLLECISYSILDIIAIGTIIFSTAVFIIWYKVAKVSVSLVPYIPSILFKSMVQLFYGYWIFAKGELRDYGYTIFSWVHATIAILVCIVAVYIALLYRKIYKDVNRMSMQELMDRENKTRIRASEILKSYPWLNVLPVLLPTPYIASKIFKIWTADMDVGIGLAMWILACCWGVLFSAYFPKFIIYMKHKSDL